jgi:NDP-mannose synthase
MRAFLQNGKRQGVNIHYSYEEKPLGTAGPLALIRNSLTGSFFVTNGDVLTTLPLEEMMATHQKSGAVATIAVHKRQMQVDLGVVQCDADNVLTGYIEKPTYDFLVSMGIYIFKPQVLDFIPDGQYLDFPDLVLKLIAHGEKVMSFPFDGYWQDLGHHEDYEQAVKDFERLRPQILGETTS